MTTYSPSDRISSKSVVLDVDEVIQGLPHIPRVAIVQAAFGSLPPAIWEALISPDMKEVFARATARLLVDLGEQIQTEQEVNTILKQPFSEEKATWLRRTLKVWSHVRSLDAYLQSQLGLGPLGRLLVAVRDHKTEVRERDAILPEDEALWKVADEIVEELWAP